MHSITIFTGAWASQFLMAYASGMPAPAVLSGAGTFLLHFASNGNPRGGVMTLHYGVVGPPESLCTPAACSPCVDA